MSKKMRAWIAAVIIIAAAVAVSTWATRPAHGAQAMSGNVIDGVRVIHLMASRWSFSPNPIVVNKGDRLKILANSRDVTHGFALDGYGIDSRIPSGRETVIEFTADKAGTLEFPCSVYCGAGYGGGMRGKLIVQ
jgi:cytochrome c oxidase subunit 2